MLDFLSLLKSNLSSVLTKPSSVEGNNTTLIKKISQYKTLKHLQIFFSCSLIDGAGLCNDLFLLFEQQGRVTQWVFETMEMVTIQSSLSNEGTGTKSSPKAGERGNVVVKKKQW